MPFGNAAGFTRTYLYGAPHLLHPPNGEAEALAEMRRRNDFWNALVELDRTVTAARDADLDLLRPGWRDLEGAERKALWHEPEVKDLLDRHERDRRQRVHDLTTTSGLYWSNYNAVLLSYEQARRKPGVLRFHAWARSTGTLTVQIQGGISVADLFAGRSNQIQIDPVDLEALSSSVRSVRRRTGRTTLRFRVRSGPNREPVWVTLPLVIHRPLPADGRIKMAILTRQPLPGQVRWSLSLVVAMTAPAPRSGATAGVDIGWRRTEHGIRVAVWVGSDGERGEVVLPHRLVEALDQNDQVRSLRDKHFNAVRPALTAWLANAPDVPDWLREVTVTLPHWRSAARLAGLVRRWESERFHGDDAGFALAHAWWRRDDHLWRWEVHQRDQVLRHRREVYRRAAHALVERYATIGLERFDLSPVARTKQRPFEDVPPDGADLSPVVRAQRVQAAVSVFRDALRTAARHAGVEVVEVPAALTTRICPRCGHDNRAVDFAAAIVYRCQGCGVSHDQDEAAAEMILRAALRGS